MIGQIRKNPILSVETKRTPFSKYIDLPEKPLILYKDMVLQHIAENDFVISGTGYGDEAEHYFRINDPFVFVITNATFKNVALSDLVNTSSGPIAAKEKQPKLTYIMHDTASGYFKIGRSSNPKVRETTLQAEKPTVRLVAILEKDIEASLHEQFKEYRIRGEWFKLSWDNVLDIINYK